MTAWRALTAALAVSLVAAAPGHADVAPDPTDPTSPYVIIALILVVAGLGVFFYRRRTKK